MADYYRTESSIQHALDQVLAGFHHGNLPNRADLNTPLNWNSLYEMARKDQMQRAMQEQVIHDIFWPKEKSNNSNRSGNLYNYPPPSVKTGKKTFPAKTLPRTSQSHFTLMPPVNENKKAQDVKMKAQDVNKKAQDVNKKAQDVKMKAQDLKMKPTQRETPVQTVRKPLYTRESWNKPMPLLDSPKPMTRSNSHKQPSKSEIDLVMMVVNANENELETIVDSYSKKNRN